MQRNDNQALDEVVNKRFWVVRAGRGGAAHRLFVDRSQIALEDGSMGPLRQLKCTREAFCHKYRDSRPDESKTGTASIAGKYFRFFNEVRIGDVVLYPCLEDKSIHVGKVVGKYKFVSTSDFPHQRKTKWAGRVPKADLSIETQYELGAARTFFEFRRNKLALAALFCNTELEILLENE